MNYGFKKDDIFPIFWILIVYDVLFMEKYKKSVHNFCASAHFAVSEG